MPTVTKVTVDYDDGTQAVYDKPVNLVISCTHIDKDGVQEPWLWQGAHHVIRGRLTTVLSHLEAEINANAIRAAMNGSGDG